MKRSGRGRGGNFATHLRTTAHAGEVTAVPAEVRCSATKAKVNTLLREVNGTRRSALGGPYGMALAVWGDITALVLKDE